MNDTGPRQLRIVKGTLWFIAGLAGTVTMARFLAGLGPVTNLTDRTPWGLWIGFDVLSGVALAAGGFVLAATVYVLRRERFRPLLRPAILTAFLGYVAVVMGLLFDLGRPWNIWRPMFFWQHHSVLFEVAWCVILYTTVLAFEFAPVPLAESRFHGVARAIKRATLPLVILGIMLSTLHQSSLGSLFLITPGRLHPLWYSPILPLLFLTSAVSLGLAMVTLESRITTWLYGRKPEDRLLSGLMKPLAVVLSLYLVLRLSDLLIRGQLGRAFIPSWETALFWIEILVSSILPVASILRGWALRSRRGQLATAVLVVIGFVLMRLNVGGISGVGIVGSHYIPAWPELVVTLGVVSLAALVFFFFVEHFKIYASGEPEEVKTPSPRPMRVPLYGFRTSSLLFIAGLATAFALLPGGAVLGARQRKTPVHEARRVPAKYVQRLNPPLRVLQVVDRTQAPATQALPPDTREVFLIDGNHGHELTLFDHEQHIERTGGKNACSTCHHLNRPNDRESSCWECHRDEYLPTDIFRHSVHIEATGGNEGCRHCHLDNEALKTRSTSRPCRDCHTDMLAGPSDLIDPPAADSPFRAVSYMAAMHGLCLRCHEREDARRGEKLPVRALCSTCHPGPVDLAPMPSSPGKE